MQYEILDLSPGIFFKRKVVIKNILRAMYSGTCLYSLLLRRQRSGGSGFEVSLGKKVRPYQKNN
jgi:hypothetical protein